jgi:hypothetical protein
MLKVRLRESYPNQFWNSGDGFTIAKSDRVGKIANENNYVIKNALTQGILEVVDQEEVIIDAAPVGIKEVVTKKNRESIKKALSPTGEA